MTDQDSNATPLARVRQRIIEEIRPKLDLALEKGGYDCCGCSTYDQIVDDIVAILDAEETPGG